MKTGVAIVMMIGSFVLGERATTAQVTQSRQKIGGVLVSKGYMAGQGDVGRFILKIAVRFGKEVSPDENAPMISSEWRYSEYHHSHDIKITLAKENHPVVKAFLDRFFGPAKSQRDDGYALYGFAKPINGGSIMVSLSREDGKEITWIYIHPEVFQDVLFPPFGELARAGDEWRLREKGKGDDSPWRWVVYTNAANGDLLSYAARRIEPGQKDLITFTDTAREIFPAGLPVWSSEPKPTLITASLRYGVTRLGLINARTKQDLSQEALEVSFVQAEEHGTNRLAHGYVLICDDVAVFVQHTSMRVITPEFAKERAVALLRSRKDEEEKRKEVE